MKTNWSIVFPLVGLHTMFLIGANLFLYTEFDLFGMIIPGSEVSFQMIFFTTLICTWKYGLSTARAAILFTVPVDFIMTITAQMLQTGHWTTDGTYQIAFAATGAYLIGQMIAARSFDYMQGKNLWWIASFIIAFMIGQVYDTLAFYAIFTLDKADISWLFTMFTGIQVKFTWMFSFFPIFGYLTYLLMKAGMGIEQRKKCCS